MSGGIASGLRHMRSEWGRWWRAEDLTDTHVAHRILNDQFRMWRQLKQRANAEVQQNISLLRQQQRQQTYMQMQRMQMQRRGRGGYGYGFGFGGGASPMISYRMMQWAQLQIRMGQEEFRHLEVTGSMLQIGRGQVRSRRHLAAAAWMVALPLLWVGLWWISALAALTVTAVTAAAVTLLAWVQGRRPTRRRPPVPRLLFIPPEPPAHTELAEEPEPEPFPLSEAGRDPRRVRETVRLALLKHKRRVEIDEIRTPAETQYGWEVPLVLKSGSLADFPPILKDLATPLRVGTGRIMAAAASPDDAAEIKLRILTRDPFEHPLPIPTRPPGSCSILNPFDIGLSIEGETTPVVLGGQHVIIVADTGGGKTALVQRIAEYVTACHDAVVVDIDPVKRGLKVFQPLAAMTARTAEEAETVLERLINRARSRIASMPATQNIWNPTFEEPAIVVILDEFVKLSARGKQLAAELLRNLGREALISVVIITQDATEDMLGDAIADVPGVRIMLPCRSNDVPLVVGRSNAISLGWWPHLLIPSPDHRDPADAGRFYAITPRHREPLLRYASLLPPEEAARRVAERLHAPRPRLEADTEQAPEIPPFARLLLEAFAAHSDPDVLSVEDIGKYLARTERDIWTQWDDRPTRDRRAQMGRHLKGRMREAGLSTLEPVRMEKTPGRPSGYRLADLKANLEELAR
ncbi:hypothetical protein B7755_052090 [Streptomyces sp. NBS 14/10]|uniref:hypothetical protein n=1 Tax=Streptomyces sp. NBS 14/10 TaxID=1945643 RepID=UPI000B7DE235|nr:hypothetical protein [Streptomyces sp. NBS 14/10]KAK1176690.1 hypothetical protein B7755_052090 [Streptomyces sp. NBS 14/10]